MTIRRTSSCWRTGGRIPLAKPIPRAASDPGKENITPRLAFKTNFSPRTSSIISKPTTASIPQESTPTVCPTAADLPTPWHALPSTALPLPPLHRYPGPSTPTPTTATASPPDRLFQFSNSTATRTKPSSTTAALETAARCPRSQRGCRGGLGATAAPTQRPTRHPPPKRDTSASRTRAKALRTSSGIIISRISVTAGPTLASLFHRSMRLLSLWISSILIANPRWSIHAVKALDRPLGPRLGRGRIVEPKFLVFRSHLGPFSCSGGVGDVFL